MGELYKYSKEGIKKISGEEIKRELGEVNVDNKFENENGKIETKKEKVSGLKFRQKLIDFIAFKKRKATEREMEQFLKKDLGLVNDRIEDRKETLDLLHNHFDGKKEALPKQVAADDYPTVDYEHKMDKAA
jgi:hypothetical protein